VGERGIIVKRQLIIFYQLYHGANKFMFNEIMMRSALYSANTLSYIYIVLADWNNNPWTDMSLHLDTLSWFRANQSLLLLRNAVYVAEKQQITNFIVFGLTQSGVESTIYCTRADEHTNHYTTDVVKRYRRH
jgi:hypothetical protein